MPGQLADTELARWLDKKRATWYDEETGRYGLSGNELARRVGISQAQLSTILSEGHIPKAEHLNLIAEFFEVSPMLLYRLAYLPESEGDEEFPKEIRDKFRKLETILAELPHEVQLRFIDDLLNYAELHSVAAEKWTEYERT